MKLRKHGFFLPVSALFYMVLACQPTGSNDASPGSHGPGNPLREEKVEILRISDGDSFQVRVGDSSFRVRMHGVDAPELDQPYGRQSRYCLKEILSVAPIRLQEEYKDPYGRMVATILDENGQDLNERAVRRGCAWAYVHYSSKYSHAERQARKERLGLWEERNPIPPWMWRRR